MSCAFLRPHATRTATRTTKRLESREVGGLELWYSEAIYVSLCLASTGQHVLGRASVTQTPRRYAARRPSSKHSNNKVRARRAYQRDFFSSRAANSGRMKDAAWTSGL